MDGDREALAVVVGGTVLGAVDDERGARDVPTQDADAWQGDEKPRGQGHERDRDRGPKDPAR